MSDDDDGVALYAIAHPRGPWWRRLWWAIFPPRLSKHALMVQELDLKPKEQVLAELNVRRAELGLPPLDKPLGGLALAMRRFPKLD